MDTKTKRLLKDLSNNDDDLRALAAMTLMKLDFPDRNTREEVLAALMGSTSDKNIAVRFFARKAIDKIKRAEKLLITPQNTSAESLDDRLNSSVYNDRLSAVMQIGNEKKSQYVDSMIKMLDNEEHPFVRAALISNLKLFIAKQQAEILSRFLSDTDSRVRANTIEALEYLKVDQAIPSLFSALNDQDNRIRAAAAKALQAFGEEKVFVELKKMLASDEQWMKGSAIYALSHVQAAEAVELLMQVARDDAHDETRVKAIIALANFHDVNAYTFLKSVAQNAPDYFKEAANRALRLNEEKFGPEPPSESLDNLASEKADENDANQQSENKEPAQEQDKQESPDIKETVTRFFRGGKDKQVGLSDKAKISFSETGFQKELDEICKEGGKAAFELYQSGDMELPDLLTIGHEILRMNFFIQKYTEKEDKSEGKKSEGFFEQIKKLFTQTQESKKSASKVETFTKKRDELFVRLGRATFKKFDTQEYQPKTVEPFYLSWQNHMKKKNKAG